MALEHIVPLQERHLDSLIRLEQACFSIPWSREMFQDEIKSKMAHYFVAEVSGQVVGYAGMWKVVDEGQITNIAVHPAFRRRGIASRLLRQLIDTANAMSLAFLTLEVREHNGGAQRLYQSFGFGQVGKRNHYYADTDEAAILMTLWLKEGSDNHETDIRN